MKMPKHQSYGIFRAVRNRALRTNIFYLLFSFICSTLSAAAIMPRRALS